MDNALKECLVNLVFVINDEEYRVNIIVMLDLYVIMIVFMISDDNDFVEYTVNIIILYHVNSILASI
jgi:hypothetical protein